MSAGLRRWVLPVSLAVLALHHAARFRAELAQASGPRVLLAAACVAAVAACAAASLWCAVRPERSDRLAPRLGRSPALFWAAPGLALATLVCSALSDSWVLLPTTGFAVALAALGWVLSSAKPREAAFQWVFVALLGGFGLVLSELGLRLAVALYFMPRMDAQIEESVRGRWPTPQVLGASSFRILGVADSFGVAGRARNYHHELERQLREAGHDVAVANVSVSNFEPHDELRLVRRFGPRLEPDVVIQGFFVGNDLRRRVGELVKVGSVDVRHVGLRDWPLAEQRLELFDVLSGLVYVAHARFARQFQVRAGTEGETALVIGEERFHLLERRRLERICSRKIEPGTDWRHASAALDAFRGEVAQLGAEYLLVIHPAEFQVDRSLEQRLVAEYALDPKEYDCDMPQRFLGEYCESRDVRCVDLRPAFRERAGAGPLYLPRNSHYNLAGNVLAGEVLADRVIDLLSAPSGVK